MSAKATKFHSHRLGSDRPDLQRRNSSKRCERILNEKLVLVSYMKSHRGNLRPMGMRYFFKLFMASLKYQPPISMG